MEAMPDGPEKEALKAGVQAAAEALEEKRKVVEDIESPANATAVVAREQVVFGTDNLIGILSVTLTATVTLTLTLTVTLTLTIPVTLTPTVTVTLTLSLPLPLPYP